MEVFSFGWPNFSKWFFFTASVIGWCFLLHRMISKENPENDEHTCLKCNLVNFSDLKIILALNPFGVWKLMRDYISNWCVHHCNSKHHPACWVITTYYAVQNKHFVYTSMCQEWSLVDYLIQKLTCKKVNMSLWSSGSIEFTICMNIINKTCRIFCQSPLLILNLDVSNSSFKAGTCRVHSWYSVKLKISKMLNISHYMSPKAMT